MSYAPPHKVPTSRCGPFYGLLATKVIDLHAAEWSVVGYVANTARIVTVYIQFSDMHVLIPVSRPRAECPSAGFFQSWQFSLAELDY